MRVRLSALPVVALAAGAIDTVLVRRALPHRPADTSLFLQAAAIWLAFGLIAYLPARLLGGVLSRLWPRAKAAAQDGPDGPQGRGSATSGAFLLAYCTVLPVVAHAALSRHIQTAGDLSALRQVRPWVELGAAVIGAAVVATLLAGLARRVAPALVVAFVLAAAGVVGLALPYSARSASPGPSPAVGAGDRAGADTRPDILLLVWDTTRAKSLASYGYDRATTPFLSELAERAIVFEEARSVSSFTYTSHLSMLTGVYPSHHGGRLTHMSYDPERTPSVARLLNEAGYRTGGFVGTGVLRANTGIVEGFERYDDRVDPAVCDTNAWKLVHDVQAVLASVHPAFRGNGNPHGFETFQRPASEVLASALEWIRQDDPRPWFCMVNLYDVHWPYLPAGEGRERFVRPYSGPADGYLFRSDDYHLPPGGKKGAKFNAEDDRHLTDLYDAEMYNLDRDVAAFVQAIEASSGAPALIVTSDHGEAFGENETYGHHGVLEAQVRIPLMLVHPGSAPARVRERASGVDVATTVLSLAGIPRPEHMTGRDLTAAGDPERVLLVEHRDTATPEEAEYCVYQGPWKLTRHGTIRSKRFELFDLERDPEALVDVAAEHPERVRELAALLERTQAGWGGEREIWSADGEAPADHLKALGYGGGDDEE